MKFLKFVEKTFFDWYISFLLGGGEVSKNEAVNSNENSNSN